MRARTWRALLATTVLLLAACTTPSAPEPPPVTPATPEPTPTPTPIADPRDAMRPLDAPPSFLDGGDLPSLRRSIDRSLSWLSGQPDARALTFGPRTVTAKELRDSLIAFKKMLADDPPPAVLAERVRGAFDVLEAAGGLDGSVLFTGYYEPVIEASLTRRPGYDVPIYKRPSDFVRIDLAEFGERFANERDLLGRLEGGRVKPYWSRDQIVAGSLKGRRLELAWAKDAVDLFFVEIQGSGTLKLPDGKKKRIGYAGSNGRPYQSIGSLLIQEGHIPAEKMSMQAIRAWLAANPAERARVLGHNESYVFFRFLDSEPVGSLGRPVTPQRSIATDHSLFPPGALAFIQTDFPIAVTTTAGESIAWTPLERFVLNQDTGGAIKGAGRVDVFWGQGPEAALAAGMMKQRGRLFWLAPKAVPPAVAGTTPVPPAPAPVP